MFRLLRNFVLTAAAAGRLTAQSWNDFETAPHQYWEAAAMDAATLLHNRMERREVTLPAAGDPKVFLAAYLEALKVPVSSQIMVFSKTSLQRSLMSGKSPRALYFNDDCYVGWMPGGMIEVTGIDPVLGGVFYIFNVPDKAEVVPEFQRRKSCLGCHAGSATNFLPGLMVRSVFTTENGEPRGEAGRSNGGHEPPFAQRWAGWFVSGELTGMTHAGNAFFSRGGPPRASGAPDEVLAPGLHLLPGSDPVALLLHDHQIKAVNLLMEANYRLRTVLLAAGGTDPVEKRALPDGAREMIDEQADKILRYFLFRDEARLPGPVKGASAFVKDFAATRRADRKGRSLRDLDMQSRLLTHRCSFMIYSAAFRGLPDHFRVLIRKRFEEELTTPSGDGPAAHLPADERTAIREILSETMPP